MTKEEAKKYCDNTTKPYRYWDKNGNEIKEGDFINLYGREMEVYLLSDEYQLGVDATNPKWIEDGRAMKCEYGCYPLTLEDCQQAELLR